MTISNIHINDYYEDLLDGKDLTLPRQKSFEFIKNRNRHRGYLTAFSEGNKKISYDEMYDRWNADARLFSSLGIRKDNNSRVLVLMPNVASTGIIDYALDMTGAVCDFIDPTSSPEKIEAYVRQEKISDLIILNLMYEANKKQIDLIKKQYELKNVIVYYDAFFNSLLSRKLMILDKVTSKKNQFSKKIIMHDAGINNSRFSSIYFDEGDSDLSLITHTSGTTTGIGKPIPLTDLNRNTLVFQHDLAELNYEPGMSMLHFIPYFAAYGAVNTTHLGLSKGMELQEIPLFRPEDFGRILLKHKSNIVLANMPAWMNLVNNPDFKDCDLSFLRIAISGGTPNSEDEERKVNSFFKSHGADITLSKGYGLSECCGCAAYELESYKHIGGMGVVLPLTDLKLRDNTTGEIFSPSANASFGEALLSSPAVTSGILDGNVVVPKIEYNGKFYLCTKDLIEVNPDGSLNYVDRIDRMFPRYDAYNVYPQPLEELLKSEDEIDNCFICSYNDSQKNGIMPIVYIELAPNCDGCNKEELIFRIINSKFLSNSSSEAYQANFRDIPRKWVFVDKIPKNTMGKNDYYTIKIEGISGEEFLVDVLENNMKVDNIVISKILSDEKVLKKQK